MNDAPLWLLFSILGGLLVLSGYFSGTETAMMALNRYRLKHLRKRSRGARRAYKMLKRPDRLIGIILIGNNLVNIFAASIATIIGIRLYGNAGIAAASLLLTLVLLIFSEVTPKTLAALHPEKVAFPSSLFLKPLLILFYPLVWIVNHISNGLLRLAGVKAEQPLSHSLSKDELRTVVDESGEHIADHQDMLLNVLDLETMTVNDIMVPRNDIVGLNLDDSLESLLDTMITCGFTRLPVYHGDINNISGILHMKRVNRLLRDGREALTVEAIRRFAAEPYFVPESTPLTTQLFNFRLQKRRVALVVDEYGEILGLVTLEDILEEIVGDFTTNQEAEEEAIVELDNNRFLIDGAATIREINKATSWNLPLNGPKTLNGFVMEQLENFPDGNVSFTLGNYRFETVKLAEKKVAKVYVTRIRLEIQDDEDDAI